MLDLKPYGAFLETSVRPLIEELKEIKVIKNIDLDCAIKRMVQIHIFWTIFDFLKTVISTAIIGCVVCKIYQS